MPVPPIWMGTLSAGENIDCRLRPVSFCNAPFRFAKGSVVIFKCSDHDQPDACSARYVIGGTAWVALSRRSECSDASGRVVAIGMNKISYAG